MKRIPFVILALAAGLAAGCKDKDAELELQSLKHENSRLKKSERKLTEELEAARKVPEGALKDPGIRNTPDHFRLYALMTEQESDAVWLVTCLQTVNSILVKNISPVVWETIGKVPQMVEDFDGRNQEIERLYPGVIENPSTDIERVREMQRLKEVINRRTVEIHQLEEALPKKP